MVVINGQRWLYPAIDRETLRFDSYLRHSLGFSISPHEPPMVPIRATYEIFYYDAEGKRLPTPRGKGLIELEPIVRISIESGECG